MIFDSVVNQVLYVLVTCLFLELLRVFVNVDTIMLPWLFVVLLQVPVAFEHATEICRKQNLLLHYVTLNAMVAVCSIDPFVIFRKLMECL